MKFLENGFHSTIPSTTYTILQFKQGLCVKLQHKKQTWVYVYQRRQQYTDGHGVDGETEGKTGDCVGKIWQCRLCVQCESPRCSSSQEEDQAVVSRKTLDL